MWVDFPTFTAEAADPPRRRRPATLPPVRVLVAAVMVSVLAASCAASVDVAVDGAVDQAAVPTVAPTSTPSTTPAEAAQPSPTSAATPPVEDTGEDAEIAGTAGFALPFAAAGSKGLMTPTNIPVAVLTSTEEGLIIRTPCGRIRTVPDVGERLEGATVVLDPGHGGPIDTGAVGPNGLVERDLNLTVARAVQARLEAAGVSVVLTRTADYPTTLATRSALADHLGAELMVSIHHNAPTFGRSDTPGTEVFVQSGSDASRRLGGLVYDALFETLSGFGDIGWTAASDAGVMAVLNDRGIDAYGMIRRPETVAVLAELAYISNAPEAELMTTNAYITAVSGALEDAINRYLASPENEGRGFQPNRVFNPDAAPTASVCDDPPLG